MNPYRWQTNKRIHLSMSLIALLLLALTSWSWANSAQPPSIIVIVPNCPESLEVTAKTENGTIPGNKVDKFLEVYFAFYPYELNNATSHVLHVANGDVSFDVPVVMTQGKYNTIYTLDLKNKTVVEGKLPFRDFFFAGLRLSATLLLEGAVFLLAGFRERKTWAAFFGINLLTQGALNVWLSGMLPLQSYGIMILVFGEFFVFLSELLLFGIVVSEHRRRRVLGTTFLANAVSLVLGGLLISWLPL